MMEIMNTGNNTIHVAGKLDKLGLPAKTIEEVERLNALLSSDHDECLLVSIY